ncbi:AMP-binding enzyme domain-containing protein [Sarocladium implicatum]|nr:AMP-binding enzyme domain-containing protein [Sarocladium implicatum]
MPFLGPPMDPSPSNVSIWQWLFHDALPTDRGFQDAATSSLLSLAAIRHKAILLSAALTRLHALLPHQTIAIVARNSIIYPLPLFAASRLGAVVTCLPPESHPEDLAYYFQAAGVDLVFADNETVDSVRKAAKSVGLGREKVVMLEEAWEGGEMTVGELVKEGEQMEKMGQTVHEWKPETRADEICAFLCFSSGTTGKPKAVRISHTNVISQLRQVQMITRPGKSNTVLGVLPFYHITGLVHLLHLPFLLNQNIVVVNKFDMKSMLDAITRFRCNELWLVPPLLIRLLNDPFVYAYDLSHVEQFDTGAAPLSQEVIKKLSKRFPKVAIRQSWGMTESTSVLTTTPPGLDTWENAASVGTIVPGTTIRVVDPETGKDVGVDEKGELWVKGPQVSLGYLNNPSATASTYDSNGYLHTGDLGSISATGFITIHDRLKELIKVRGHPVPPATLEDILHGHPDVADVAVVGVPDDYSGEVPQAWVVLTKEGGKRGEERVRSELVKLVEGRTPRWMWLKGGVIFVDEIPKSRAGKILRRVIKDKAKAMGEAKSKL